MLTWNICHLHCIIAEELGNSNNFSCFNTPFSQKCNALNSNLYKAFCTNANVLNVGGAFIDLEWHEIVPAHRRFYPKEFVNTYSEGNLKSRIFQKMSILNRRLVLSASKLVFWLLLFLFSSDFWSVFEIKCTYFKIYLAHCLGMNYYVNFLGGIGTMDFT